MLGLQLVVFVAQSLARGALLRGQVDGGAGNPTQPAVVAIG